MSFPLRCMILSLFFGLAAVFAATSTTCPKAAFEHVETTQKTTSEEQKRADAAHTNEAYTRHESWEDNQ